MVAERFEVYGDHLVLLHSTGKLVGLFVIHEIDSWYEIPPPA
jgi:hypothetical protein